MGQPSLRCENYTFNHFVKTGSELKLTDFREKSNRLQSSVPVYRLINLPCRQKDLSMAHIPTPQGTTSKKSTFEKQADPEKSRSPRKI
jgi:hypothetical protein